MTIEQKNDFDILVKTILTYTGSSSISLYYYIPMFLILFLTEKNVVPLDQLFQDVKESIDKDKENAKIKRLEDIEKANQKLVEIKKEMDGIPDEIKNCDKNLLESQILELERKWEDQISFLYSIRKAHSMAIIENLSSGFLLELQEWINKKAQELQDTEEQKELLAKKRNHVLHYIDLLNQQQEQQNKIKKIENA